MAFLHNLGQLQTFNLARQFALKRPFVSNRLAKYFQSLTPQTTSPAEVGLVSARNRLLLAAREAESGETKDEKGESGRLRNRGEVVADDIESS
jgi:hypothetical protein